MIITYSRAFKKSYKKHPARIREKFDQRILSFLVNPYAPALNNHSLTGEWTGCRSINITGDVRAVFVMGKGRIHFVAINTHSELYS